MLTFVYELEARHHSTVVLLQKFTAMSVPVMIWPGIIVCFSSCFHFS